MNYFILIVIFLFQITICYGQRPNHNSEVEMTLHKISFCLNYWSNPVDRELRIENSEHENINLSFYSPTIQGTGVSLNNIPAGDYKLIITYKKYEGETVRNGSGDSFELISKRNIILNTFLTFDEVGNISENFCANGQYYYLLSNPLKVIVFFEIR